jgi:outer membrane lipoprotein-sorting protein
MFKAPMNKLLIFTLASVLSAAVFAQNDPAARGLEIAREAKKRDTGYKDFTTDVTMTLRNKEGQESSRQLAIKTLEQEKDERALVLFTSPADISGTALLTYAYKNEPDDQWLYLPAVKRVKRIASGNKTGSFVGSEFSYEDISPQQVDKFTYRYLRDETVEGQKCFVVERYPKDPKSGYKRQVYWIDQAEYRPLKAELYDPKDVLLKTLTFSGYKKYVDQFWRPDVMLMQNHQSGKSTKLTLSNYKFRTGLTERDFDSDTLNRLR